jgi:hypothetical protein
MGLTGCDRILRLTILDPCPSNQIQLLRNPYLQALATLLWHLSVHPFAVSAADDHKTTSRCPAAIGDPRRCREIEPTAVRPIQPTIPITDPSRSRESGPSYRRGARRALPSQTAVPAGPQFAAGLGRDRQWREERARRPRVVIRSPRSPLSGLVSVARWRPGGQLSQYASDVAPHRR